MLFGRRSLDSTQLSRADGEAQLGLARVGEHGNGMTAAELTLSARFCRQASQWRAGRAPLVDQVTAAKRGGRHRRFASMQQLFNQLVQFVQQGIAAIFRFVQLIWTWSVAQITKVI